MNKFLIILTALVSIGLASCENANCNLNDKKLTAETHIDANTMSCKIDGVVWVANGVDGNDKIKGNCKFNVETDFKRTPLKPLLQIIAKTNHKCARKNASLFFIIDTSGYESSISAKRCKLGAYSTDFKSNMAGYSDMGKGNTIDPNFWPVHYGTNPSGKEDSWVIITHNDPVAGIISGRFEYYAENMDGVE